MLDLNNNQFLTEEQIKEQAPSIYTMKASKDTSKHYVHIPTTQVINDMEALGWGVVDVKQVRSRDRQRGLYTKHLVVFGNNDLKIEGKDGDTVFPRILLTNAHDGKTAFTFAAGLFRLVCENGLVISDQNFGEMKIRHMGYDITELKETITKMVEQLPLTVECMNKLKAITLSQRAKEDFALKALGLRFNTDNKNFEIETILEPTREEDKGDDVWSVYNVLQEKLIHGLVNYGVGAKIRKARKIKNFQQDMKLNQELYNLALEYAN
jgi:hypothetical protein